MFGNLQGWLISLVVAAGMAVSLGWAAKPQGITRATHDPAVNIALSPIVLPSSAAALIPAPRPCDGEGLYRAALDDFAKNRDAYEDFRVRPNLSKLPSLPAIQSILNASHCPSASIFRDRPAELINYAVDHPQLEALKTLGNLTINAGLLYKVNRDYDLARQYIDAGFALGNKLFSERLTFEEMGAGLGLMQGAARSLQSLAKDKGDAGLAAAASAFLKDSQDAADRWINCYKIVGAIDENYAGAYTGDVFAIAQSPSADPMWRVEAIKHLGHYQYNAITRTDEIWARRILQKLSADPNQDPRVHAAAVAARDLTVEQHRGTR